VSPARRDRKGRAIAVYQEHGDGGRQFGRPAEVLLIFPQPYAVGMSNLGFLFVYRRLREFPEVNVERAFLAADGTLSRSVESNREWREFPVLALSAAYEPDLLRFARWARAAGLELDAAARGGRPWLLAGGTGTQVNPRLLAGVADRLVPGRWEESEGEVRDWLRGLLGLPPAPVPLAPPALVHNTLFAATAVFADTLLLEVQRGCRCRCPFCWYAHHQPVAPPPAAAELLAAVDRHPEVPSVGLVSASLLDYPQFAELLTGLQARGKRIGFASLRLDRLTPEILRLLADGGMQTLTVAPESGAERWKRAIGKPWPAELLRERLALAVTCGIRRVKLYYLYGFPGETAAERSATVREIAGAAAALHRLAGLEVTFNPLTPKPGTPWADVPLPALAVEHELRREVGACRELDEVAVEWGSRREAELQVRLALAADNLAALCPAG